MNINNVPQNRNLTVMDSVTESVDKIIESTKNKANIYFPEIAQNDGEDIIDFEWRKTKQEMNFSLVLISSLLNDMEIILSGLELKNDGNDAFEELKTAVGESKAAIHKTIANTGKIKDLIDEIEKNDLDESQKKIISATKEIFNSVCSVANGRLSNAQKKEIDKLTEENDENTEKISELNKEISKLNSDIEEKDDELENLKNDIKEKNKANNKLSENIETLEDHFKSAKKEIKSNNSKIDDLSNKVLEITDSLRGAEKEITNNQLQINKNKEEMLSLNKVIVEKDKEIDNLEKDKADIANKLKLSAGVIDKLTIQNAEMKKEIDKIEESKKENS